MAASGKGKPRKRRYVAEPPQGPRTPTPLGLTLLTFLADFGLLSVPQLALLAEISEQAVRRQMRSAFDAGWVRVIALPRLLLADPDTPNTADLAFGSAPNVYQLTRQGLTLLLRLGRIGQIEPPPVYGPRNAAFLAHELGCRDCLIWLARCARTHPGHKLISWRLGGSAEISLERLEMPKVARPDGWFLYTFHERVLAACLEYDRSTERGPDKWLLKIRAFTYLFQSDRFLQATGAQYGRVLVVCLSARRRDQLAELIAKRAPPWLADRFYVAERSVLDVPDPTLPLWRKPGVPDLVSLVPPSLAYPSVSSDKTRGNDDLIPQTERIGR